jgi:hypothetical protein
MRGRLLQALPIVVVVVAIPLALAVARDGDAPVRAAAAGEAGVTDDDGGTPMFALTALAPGRSTSRCIRIRYDGDGGGSVRLDGKIKGSALASRIALVVERGSGGSFEGCRGFRGERVFAGTLAEFAAADGRVWRADDGDAATYRFTATAASDLPEREDHTAATFTWHATAIPVDGDGDPPGGGPGGPGGGPPVHAGVPGGRPGAVSPGTPGAGGTGGGAGGRDARGGDRPGRRRGSGGGAGERGGTSGSGGGATAGGAGGAGAPHDARGGLRRAFDALASAAVDVGERAAFPLLLLILIGLFLAAQHRIDGRDPKLALAPVHAETDLPFTPLRLGGPAE